MRGTGIVTNPPYDAVTGTAKQFVEKQSPMGANTMLGFCE